MTNTKQQTTRSIEAEGVTTGLRWPSTWRATYFLVIASFVSWVLLLLAMQEFCK